MEEEKVEQIKEKVGEVIKEAFKTEQPSEIEQPSKPEGAETKSIEETLKEEILKTASISDIIDGLVYKKLLEGKPIDKKLLILALLSTKR